jgi:tetratricopeptide (TPR) repeat protein
MSPGADPLAVAIKLHEMYNRAPGAATLPCLLQAIDSYQAALRMYTEWDAPQEWAKTQNNLGAAYQELPVGDREENLRLATACFEAALRVYTECDTPQEWATVQNDLGNTYLKLQQGNRGESLRRAITYYEAALRVYTRQDTPHNWAVTQNNLGLA